MKQLPNSKLIERISSRMKGLSFVDRAIITYKQSGSSDEYGQITPTEIESEVICSFTDKPAKEQWAAYVDIEQVDAEIRFQGNKPNKSDMVKLLSRFNRDSSENQSYDPVLFEIIDIKDRDAFGYVCALRKVKI